MRRRLVAIGAAVAICVAGLLGATLGAGGAANAASGAARTAHAVKHTKAMRCAKLARAAKARAGRRATARRARRLGCTVKPKPRTPVTRPAGAPAPSSATAPATSTPSGSAPAPAGPAGPAGPATVEPPPPPPRPSTLGVSAYDMDGFVLRLTRTSVPAGDLTIFFRNLDVSDHNLWISGPGDDVVERISDTVGEGGSATRTLPVTAGSWRLFCSLPDHDAMTRTLTVTP